MQGPATSSSAVPGRSAAEVLRRFGEAQVATSPLSGRVAVALSESGPALRVLEAVPARSRQPALLLAVLHDLALAGRAPALAAAYARGDGDAASAAAVDTVLELSDAVVATATHRRLQADESGHGAVLHPAAAAAAHRVGARAVGLVDVGRAAGLNLTVDRVGVTYDNGQVLGDPSSPLQLTASVRGDRPLPERAVREVVVRVAVDRDPLAVTDADDVRWLRACLPPDQPERRAHLDAELALLATDPPVRLRGDPVGLVSEAVERVPAGALPVVLTTWALARSTPGDRLGFLHALEEAAADRPVAWVSAEGVGVAPAVPTLGDRRASGHSLIGLVLLGGPTRRAEALGRTWSRGRVLSWLADS